MCLAQLIFTESIAVEALQWKPSYEPSFEALMCGSCCPVWIYRYGYEVWGPIMQLVKSEAGPDMPVLGVLSHPLAIMPVEMTWLAEFMWCVWAAPGVATVTIAVSPDLSSPQNFHGTYAALAQCGALQLIQQHQGRSRKAQEGEFIPGFPYTSSGTWASVRPTWAFLDVFPPFMSGRLELQSVFPSWRFPVEWGWHFLVWRWNFDLTPFILNKYFTSPTSPSFSRIRKFLNGFSTLSTY